MGAGLSAVPAFKLGDVFQDGATLEAMLVLFALLTVVVHGLFLGFRLLIFGLLALLLLLRLSLLLLEQLNRPDLQIDSY